MEEPLRWRSLNAHCRELHWSKPRAIYELQNGLPFRTIPPGHEHEIDWHDRSQLSHFDLSASTMKIWQGVAESATAPLFLTVGIEVLPPDDAEVSTPPTASPQWAIAATRKLRADNKIAEGATKAGLARLLAAESEKAAKAGQIRRALKASYLEDQLAPWGIWPLNSLE
jgi:hypothetical protein